MSVIEVVHLAEVVILMVPRVVVVKVMVGVVVVVQPFHLAVINVAVSGRLGHTRHGRD